MCLIVLPHKHKKLMKGKALRKHSLHEKTAASVLLKLFISSPILNCHSVQLPHGPMVGDYPKMETKIEKNSIIYIYLVI